MNVLSGVTSDFGRNRAIFPPVRGVVPGDTAERRLNSGVEEPGAGAVQEKRVVGWAGGVPFTEGGNGIR